MPELPHGTLTLLFTDIEESTALIQCLGDGYGAVQAKHRELIRSAVGTHGGCEVDTQGDSFFFAFAGAAAALDAALAAQRALQSYPWPERGVVRVRMGLHTGEPLRTEEGYVGLDVTRAARIAAAGHGGQVVLSQVTADLVENDLPKGTSLRDLGVHRLRGLIRAERLFQCVSPDLRADFPDLATADTRPNNLPLQLTSLIGRERELARAQSLLQREDVRLLTLTGPGGSGKTRLAIQIAIELMDAFRDGVFLVALSPISDPQLVVSTIAQALEVRETGSMPLIESLKAFLRERRLLLFLDNFEQVLDAAPEVVGLLAACSGLKLLVTSRAALHVRGERELPVPPLELPDRARLPSPEALRQAPAVALFLERAEAVKPDFAATAATIPIVAEICARLDGLPLAIELAAARSKLLAPQAMLGRLERGLALLTGGARDLPERQRTLRDAIAWSYDLLTPAEQALFRRLSVFVGGCSLDAAEQVTRTQDSFASGGRAQGRPHPGPLPAPEEEEDRPPSSRSGRFGLPEEAGGQELGSSSTESFVLGPESSDVLEGLSSLIDKNLLRQADAGREPRFTMLETIRDFGLEALAAAGEIEATRRAHAEHFLALAEAAEQGLAGPTTGEWLEVLEREHDNLRAALRCCADHAAGEIGLRLAGALAQFWQLRGYVREGSAWLDLVLERSPEAGALARAKALTGSGLLAAYQSDFALARSRHEESLALHRAAGDRWGTAVVINDLGTVALYQGDYAAARTLYEESLAIRRELDDQRGIAVSLTNLGLVAQAQGDLHGSRRLHTESLAIWRSLGDQQGVARSLSRLGLVEGELKDFAAARAALVEGLAIARRQEDLPAVATALTNLGGVAIDQGDTATAHAHLEEGLSIRRQLGDRAAIPRSIWQLLRLAELEGDLGRARSLMEESLAITRETGDKRGVALAVSFLGDVLLKQGDAAPVRALYEESLAVRRQIGDEGGAALILARLAQVAHREGDSASARALLEESVGLLRALGDRQGLSASLTNLAQILSSEGDSSAAEERFKESLSIQRELGNSEIISLCLRGLAVIAVARQRPEHAARLYGADDALRSSLGAEDAPEHSEHRRALVAGRDADAAALADAWAAGRSLSSAEAIALALDEPLDAEDCSPRGAIGQPARAEAAARLSPQSAVLSPHPVLSLREVEVLRLIAAGKSNPQIAAELYITLNTVYRHANHIFAKIGASNRVEAATYAHLHGLD